MNNKNHQQSNNNRMTRKIDIPMKQNRLTMNFNSNPMEGNPTTDGNGRIESLMLDPLQTSSPSPSPPPLSMINPITMNGGGGGGYNVNQNDHPNSDHIVYRLALTGGKFFFLVFKQTKKKSPNL